MHHLVPSACFHSILPDESSREARTFPVFSSSFSSFSSAANSTAGYSFFSIIRESFPLIYSFPITQRIISSVTGISRYNIPAASVCTYLSVLIIFHSLRFSIPFFLRCLSERTSCVIINSNEIFHYIKSWHIRTKLPAFILTCQPEKGLCLICS